MGYPTSHVQSFGVDGSLQNGCQDPRWLSKEGNCSVLDKEKNLLFYLWKEQREEWWEEKAEKRSQYNGARLGLGGVKSLGQGRSENILRKRMPYQGSCIHGNVRLTPPPFCLFSSARCAKPTNALCELGPFWKSEEPISRLSAPQCTSEVQGKKIGA